MDDMNQAWSALVSGLELDKSSYSARLAAEHKDTTWRVALAPTTDFLDAVGAPDYDSQSMLEDYGDSPNLHYFLTVAKGKMDVVYGLRRCYPIHRSRWACLRGDTSIWDGTYVPPEMIVYPGPEAAQHLLFQAKDVASWPAQTIHTALRAAPAAAFFPPNATAAPIKVWPLLPIHPKLACLFMGGRSPQEAISILLDLLAVIPPRYARERDVLSDFLRGACTIDHANPVTSIVDCLWVHVDPSNHAATNQWFASVQAQYGCSGSNTALGVPPQPGSGPMQPIVIRNEIPSQHGASADSRRGALPYEDHNLCYLFPLVGCPVGPDGLYSGLGMESLSPFLQKLASVRAPKADTRSFLEHYRSTHLPERGSWYNFVWSTTLIKDIKNLAFFGEDFNCDYASRFRGLSVFSLAPISPSNVASSTAARNRMLHYEADAETSLLTPTDRMTVEALDGTWLTIPSTQMETTNWVDHTRIMVRMILGDLCPANTHLDTLWINLNQVHLTQHWTPFDWRTCVWFIHGSLREFMRKGDTFRLQGLNRKLLEHDRFNSGDLPAELRQAAPPPPPPSNITPAGSINNDGSSTISSITTGTFLGSSKRKQDQETGSNKKPAVVPFLAAHVRSLLETYKPKISKDLRANLIFPDTAHIDSILGRDYLSLVAPANKPVCLRAHVFGNCVTRTCNRAHGTTAKPSDSILAGVHTRLKTRLDALAAQHPN